ncbi:MAG: hypothetical protein ACLQVW_07930, partial [Limisphaerales bacterium]
MKTVRATKRSFPGPIGLLVLLTVRLFAPQCHAQSTVVPYSFSTIAGIYDVDGIEGWADGTNSSAQFNQPEAIAVDPLGNLYVADTFNNVIRKITPLGNNIWQVSTLAGQPGVIGFADSTTAATATFHAPQGIALDGSGNIYVADTGNNLIRKITTGGKVMTIAGNTSILFNGSPAPGYQEGPALQAQFNNPIGIAVDSLNNVYVGDYYNNVVRKLTPSGSLDVWAASTFAGSASRSGVGANNGKGASAQFQGPAGLAVDSSGNLYVADTSNNSIRKITPDGTVSILAGSPPTLQQEFNYNGGIPYGNADSVQSSKANFFLPYGVAVDGAGNVYVADTDNEEIRKISPQGAVTTLGGQPVFLLYSSPAEPMRLYGIGSGTSALFAIPYGIAVDKGGNVYVADTGNSVIRQGVAPPVQVVALEVTQVVQDWNNSVPLVQGKETYLRAHLQLRSPASPDVTVSGALLYGTAADGTPLPNSPTTPLNPGASLTVKTANASNSPVRRDFNRSLNFRLPSEWLNGTSNLRLAWPGGLEPVNGVSKDCSVTVSFSPAAVPQIKFWDVQWIGSNGTNLMGDTIHDMRNRVLSCLPATNLNVTYDTLVLPGLQTPDFGKGEQFVDRVNSLLYAARNRDYANGLITKRIYHGVIAAYLDLAENQSAYIAGKAIRPFPSFVSCATVVNTWGPGRQSVTHELGHNLGIEHDVDKSFFATTTMPTA